MINDKWKKYDRFVIDVWEALYDINADQSKN